MLDLLKFVLFCFLIALGSAISVAAQSTDQNYPTPATTSEISGAINARDVGDSRLTTYFYTFSANQGDLFVNILTKNFTGDIDIFTVSGLRPVSKIVVYADQAESETGRLLYFRKSEKLLLRIQGRTPGDEAASFRIKFAGSFVAAADAPPPPELPTVKSETETAVKVNSVGTILEVPKPSPTPAETVAEKETEVSTPPEAKAEAPAQTDAELAAETEKPSSKLLVVVTDNLPAAKPAEKSDDVPVLFKSRRSRRTTPPKKTANAKAKEAAEERAAKTEPTDENAPPTEKAPDPLEKIQLVILFKDGTSIQRSMSEVSRFTVNKGVLTVVGKDGKIERHSILDVAKVSIE